MRRTGWCGHGSYPENRETANSKSRIFHPSIKAIQQLLQQQTWFIIVTMEMTIENTDSFNTATSPKYGHVNQMRIIYRLYDQTYKGVQYTTSVTKATLLGFLTFTIHEYRLQVHKFTLDKRSDLISGTL